ncbi:MAG: tetratricopeptide repeat protein [bacterium]|nr:tetratricopeptide repeat protein [bacterium]
MASSAWWARAALVTLASALTIYACSDDRPTGPSTAPRSVYTGRDACIGCHADQAELWTDSHHDLAMQPATEATVLGDFANATYTHFDVTSTFVRKGDAFVVRTDGPDGALTDYEIAYVFGVSPLQQYLVEFPGGRMQTLPLAWDTREREAGGQRWFHVYPNEPLPAGDVLHWTGPNQTWNYMCAECHSTNLVRNYDVSAHAYATTWSDLDVSCEACHGPGSLHVAWAEGDEEDATLGLTRRLKDADGGRWVIDVETGNSERTPPRTSRTELDACAPCHARRTPLAPDAQQRPFHDAHRLALLDEGLYHADGQILEEVYVYGSFLQSRMHQKGVTCGDCHDPHSLKLRFKGNSLCSQCHYEPKYDSPEHHHHAPGSAGAQCVECHMPERTYMVVDPRRDHSLRVPRPDLSVRLGTPNACNLCHTDQDAQWAADAVEAWYGPSTDRALHYGEVFAAARAGEPSATRALAALALDVDRPGIVRATALDLLQERLDVASLPAVGAGLRDADGIVRAAALRLLAVVPQQQRLQLALPLLNDPLLSVRVEAASVVADLPQQGLDERGRKLIDERFDEYRAAQLANAERPEAHLNLGNLAAERERFAESEAAYRTALEIDPQHLQTLLNLADLYRGAGREGDAERTLREAVAIAPEDAYARHALGLALVRRGAREEAGEEFAKASRWAPEIARFGYVNAVSLHDRGLVGEAIAELESVSARHPADREVLVALVTYCRDAGQLEAAQRHAGQLSKIAPDNPVTQELLQELEADRER